ncbi:gp153 [Bacillus phage G]|uniref:Gp153 n=1 Tax=Bacillus phage G TaxID=2884420 RepID=G3MBL9_9CAUD|nr:gp153 [Bacillus phage G]AEO93413.1 gp153 [Bacillus phage G]
MDWSLGITESIKKEVGESWELIKENIGDFFLYLSQQLQEGANSFLAEMLDFVLYTPLVADNEIILSIWATVRIISFALIGVMFVWEGFKKVISTDNIIRHVEFKEMFVRMVYGIVLAVFSLDIIDLMINFNNVLIDTVKSSFPMTLESKLNINGVFSFLMVLALVIVQVVLGIKLVLQYWMRIAEIWLMAVLGPLVYVLWINPGSKLSGVLSQWVSRLTTTIFTTFIWALILAIYSGMVSMIASAGMLAGFPTLGPIAGICLSIAMLLIMIETPAFLRSFMDNQPNALHLVKKVYTNVKSSTPMGFANKAAGWILPSKT